MNTISTLLLLVAGKASRVPKVTYYSGPAGGPSHKMQQISSPKGGVMVPRVPCLDRGNWGQDLALCEYSVLPRSFWQDSGLIL